MQTLRGKIKDYRNQIKLAFDGKVYAGDDEDGKYAFVDAPKKECEEAILRMFDYIANQAIELADSGVAIENIAKRKNCNIKLEEYIAERQAIAKKYKDED